MRSFAALLIVLVLACSHCSASESTLSTSGVNIPLSKVKRTDAYLNGSPAEAGRTRAAFLKSYPASGLNTIPVTNQVQFYTTSVGIGNPPTLYNLLLDTGSSNTVVGTGKPYNRTSTSIPTGQTLNITYGSGQITGPEYWDRVSLAPGLSIANQSIGDALFSTGFNFSGLDGLIGLGPADLTIDVLTPSQNATTPTVMNNLLSQGLIKNQVFGVYLAPSTNDSDTNGLLTYGGTDRALFEGELVYAPVTTTYPSSYYWGINTTLCTYGNYTIIPNSTAGVVDSGTTPILLADDFFATYIGAIPGATYNSTLGLLEIPPMSTSSMYPLNFVIADKVLTLDVAAQLIPKSQNTAWGGDSEKQYGVVSNIGSLSKQGLDFILGMTFIERYYTVFDADNNRVGFARTKNTFST